MAQYNNRYHYSFHAAKWSGRDILPIPALFVEGRIGSDAPGLFDIDSGAFQTSHDFMNVENLKTEAGDGVIDVAGETRTTKRSAEALPIFIEDYNVGSTKVSVGASEPIQPYRLTGALGHDILKNCAILIPESSEEHLFFFCTPNTQPH